MESYKLYTAEQVRGIDYVAIHESGIAGYELMCRAGKAVVEFARSRYPATRHWLLMCGPGNNGGDGYVVARLAREAGIKVTVCSLIDPRQLRGDAAIAYADWQGRGGDVTPWPLAVDPCWDLAMDALLGTGIDREVGGDFRSAINFLNRLDCPKLAIDIPSGLNADTGNVMGCAVQAGSSVTFVGRKRGMYTADGPDHCGDISFSDLAIPASADQNHAATTGRLLNTGLLAEFVRPRQRNSHKGTFGHVIAVGGIRGMSGAIRLCGEAALRSGAGRVTLATDPVHAGLVNLGRPELMVRGIDSDVEWLSLLAEDHVVAVGPGLGGTRWSEALLQACLQTGSALVIDADGLNLLAKASRERTLKRGNWILTPHPAEAARLLNCSVADIQRDRVAAAKTIAEKFAATVILKGCGSVIADTSGEYAICAGGNPGMATAGSGDVLTGIVAAMLAQGLGCYTAARAAVLAHAEAGDRAAEIMGEIALIAGDIIDSLPTVWMSAKP